MHLTFVLPVMTYASPVRPSICTAPPRRQRASRALVCAILHRNGSRSSYSPPPHDSYLQCVECRAVYSVEPEELEGAPRVVACSACLHEWYASDADLLWGAEQAAAALDVGQKSQDSAAFVAARGMNGKNSGGRRIEERGQGEKDGSTWRKGKQGGVNSIFNSSPNNTALEENNSDQTEDDGTYSNEDVWQQDDGMSSNVDSELKKDSGDISNIDSGYVEATERKEDDETETGSNEIPNTDAELNENEEGRKSPLAEVNEKQADSKGEGKEAYDTEEPRFNIFVGNLSFRATEEDLYRAFSGYGAVLKCQVPADPSGASRGYGFVEMRSRESGLRAIESLQGTSILGRDISLNEARPKRESPIYSRRRSPWAKDRRNSGF